MHKFIAEQYLPISIEKAWEFFSSPGNLALITPPEMEFKILSHNLEKEIYEGMIIDYRVKPLLGIPVKWRTRIGKTMLHESFSDNQIEGPYSVWEHNHYFTSQNGGTMMRDVVNYDLPLGIIGNIMHSLVVRKKINYIFEFRKSILEKMFNKNDAH